MAEQPGNEELLESSSNDDEIKPQNNQQNILKKNEDISSNGTVSSFGTSNKCSNVLRPSVLAMNASAGSPVSAFASSNFGNSAQNVGSSIQKNPFSLRPSVFDSVGSPSKSLVEKKPIILRASQLELSESVLNKKANNRDGSSVLCPAKLSNPVSKSEGRNEENTCSIKTSSTSSGETPNISGESQKLNSSHISKVPQVSFVPLGITTSSSTPGGSQNSAQSSTTSTAPSFVFGQNLLDRVEVPTEAARATSETENSDTVVSENSCDDKSVNTNGAIPEMLFSSVIQKELSDKQSDIGNDEKKHKSLTEAAREYEESRAIKRKYEEVAVKTGEEEEINVLQMNCKLFAFNKEKSTWVERGRGTLRLNDLTSDNRTQSRVVMRVSGSLRVVLNTKIWPEMAVDKPSEKSVRLTALDSGGEIKVFLVMAGIKEIDHLFKALEWRVNNQKKMTTASQKNLELSKS